MKRYLEKYKGALALWMLFEFGLALSNVVIAKFIEETTNIVSDQSSFQLVQIAILGAASVLFRFGMGTGMEYFRAGFLKKCNYALRQDVFAAIMNRDINSFSENNSAKYISILNNDLMTVDSNYFRIVPKMIACVIQAAVAVGALLLLNPWITVMYVIFELFTVALPVMVEKKAAESYDVYLKSVEKSNAVMKDMLNGFEVIKTFTAEKRANELYADAASNAETLAYQYKKNVSFVSGFLTWLLSMKNQITTLICIGLMLKGYITLGMLLAARQLGGQLAGAMGSFNQLMLTFQSGKEILKKVEALLNEKHAESCKYEKLEHPVPVELCNVRFGYTDKQVLKGVTYQFKPQKKYAIVGGSGSGKSTLLKLLMSYYDDYEGTITYGGQELRTLDKGSLYENAAMIHQRVVLFEDSIKNNITIYGEKSDEEVLKAADEAGLAELIQKEDGGLHARIIENGQNFSGGEQQRFAIARAFLRQTPIMFLDEATASLDNKTSTQIENLLLSRKELTAIVVTHKLNAEILRRYDTILVLRDGKIEEDGTFDELMGRKGYFYGLYQVNQ